MARLPQPGGDSGNWGNILNDFLTQSHKTDGTMKDNVIGSAQLHPSLQTELDGKLTRAAADVSYVPVELAPRGGVRAVGRGELAVTPEDFNAVGNGTTNDGPALQAAIDWCAANGRELFIPGRAYQTNQQLELPDTVPIRIRMDPRGKIRAGSPMGAILHKGTGFCTGTNLTGVNLVGNRMADRCIDIERGHLWCIEGGIWQDALVSVADFGRLGGQVYELKWSRTRIFGLDPSLHPGTVPADMPAYGYRFGPACTDSSFYKLVVKNAKTRLVLDQGGGNVHEDEHIFGYPYATAAAPTDWVAEVGMELAGSHIRTVGVYADTQLIGVRSTGSANSVIGLLMWAPANWSNTTQVIGVDIAGSGTIVTDNMFTIQNTAPFSGYPIRVAAGARDVIYCNNLISGATGRWLASFLFLGAQVAVMHGNRRDDGANTPEYSTNSLAIGRGSDNDTVIDWAGTNPFRISTHGSGATGYSRFRPTTVGGGIMLADATNKLGFFGSTPIARAALPAAGVVTAADIRQHLINLGLAT